MFVGLWAKRHALRIPHVKPVASPAAASVFIIRAFVVTIASAPAYSLKFGKVLS
jgi:hypothetical protein